MPYYLKVIAGVLSVDAAQARRVLAYLLLDNRRLSELDDADIKRAYNGRSGIKATNAADSAQADRLASSYGI